MSGRRRTLDVLQALLLVVALPMVPVSAAVALTVRGVGCLLSERFRRRPYGPEPALRALGYGRREARELVAAGVEVETVRVLLARGCSHALARRIVL